MIIDSKLPHFLWSEALQNVVYTFNRMIRKVKHSTPYEEFFKTKPSTTFVEFGCDVFVDTIKEGRKNLEARAEKMKMLRVDDNSKGFRVWDGQRVRVERNIKFLNNSDNWPIDKSDDLSPVDDAVDQPRRSERIRNRLVPVANVLMVPPGSEPKTYKQATNCEEKQMWLESMQTELKSIERNNTWTLVDLPAGRQAIGSKWVYKIKRDENNNPVKFKSRLVAQWFAQKYGVDYDEVIAPVARAQTFRTLLSVASSKKMIIEIGFIQSKTDPCLYTYSDGSNYCFFIFHVDDLLFEKIKS